MNVKYLAFILPVIGFSMIAPVFVQESSDPVTPDELGELLFNDPVLSLDSTISCASCHKPEFAFADTSAFSIGITGIPTNRNTPSVMNTMLRQHFMWDGRAVSLEEQMLLPLEHPDELGFHRDSAVTRLNRHHYYGPAFRKMFKKDVSLELLTGVIAAFQRTLETVDTPHDRWLADEQRHLTDSQIRGRNLFFGKANCIECHFSPDFTGDEFKNIGLFDGNQLNDSGRFEHTKDSLDLGKFKVPGLRNVAITAPYMHNGMFKTLEEVVDFYNDPSEFLDKAINPDTIIQSLNLTVTEKGDLVSFLESLTDDRFKIKNHNPAVK